MKQGMSVGYSSRLTIPEPSSAVPTCHTLHRFFLTPAKTAQAQIAWHHDPKEATTLTDQQKLFFRSFAKRVIRRADLAEK